MARPSDGDLTVPNAALADRTNAVGFGRPTIWRRIATVVVAAALFSAAFVGAYLLGRGSPAPAAPPQSTWRGTVVSTVSGPHLNIVAPSSPAAAIPQLLVVTNNPVVNSTPHTQVSGTTNRQRTTPQTKTTQKPKTHTTQTTTSTNTTTDGLITVTN